MGQNVFTASCAVAAAFQDCVDDVDDDIDDDDDDVDDYDDVDSKRAASNNLLRLKIEFFCVPGNGL